MVTLAVAASLFIACVALRAAYVAQANMERLDRSMGRLIEENNEQQLRIWKLQQLHHAQLLHLSGALANPFGPPKTGPPEKPN